MKPLPIALLCLASVFGAAGASYFLFANMQETPKPQVAAAPDTHTADRVSELEREVKLLNEEVARLRSLPVPEPRVEREQPAPKTATSETVTAKATDPAPAKLDELAERIAEIEKGEAAARAMRDKAVLDLASDDGRTRGSAAELLARLAAGGDEAARQALLDGLKSENAEVRESVLEGLQESPVAELTAAMAALVNDPVPDVREELAQALSDLPVDQAAPVLMQMLRDAEPDVLREVVDALGDFKYAGAAADLLPLTRHANEELAIEASVAMRKLGDSAPGEAWVPTLGSRLTSQDVQTRRSAVENLRRLGLESARPYLEQALQDTDQRVRREAQRGLDNLNE